MDMRSSWVVMAYIKLISDSFVYVGISSNIHYSSTVEECSADCVDTSLCYSNHDCVIS